MALTEEQVREYLGQSEHYWSESRGRMEVRDMNDRHASNAAGALLRRHGELARGSALHLALLEQAGESGREDVGDEGTGEEDAF